MRKSLSAVRAASVALALLFAAQVPGAAQETKELTVVGRLTPTVEAGGWLVVADYGKYLLTNANEFRRQPWFREGAAVEATGRVRDDVMSLHMEGVPFQARTMRARGGSRRDASQNNTPQSAGGQAAVAGSGSRAFVRVAVTGESSVQAQPDTAVLTLAVITQNASPSEAQAENASKTEALVRAVRAAAGAGAEVRTSGYSLQPQYAYKEGVPPFITGYVARNAVTLTTGELSRVGSVIDAASRAGGNNVDGLSFTLRDDAQARQRALSEATREALSKARAVAATLGGSVVRVVEVQEAGATRPPAPVYTAEFGRAAGTAQAPTPVEPGSLEIRAQVQLVAEVETRQ
ncbi:MAG: SIMPL domain-containing protein [Acidobacteria bacterium]|nr:SIMPL domain-containing protein [Acidobacteriota bacterium]